MRKIKPYRNHAVYKELARILHNACGTNKSKACEMEKVIPFVALCFACGALLCWQHKTLTCHHMHATHHLGFSVSWATCLSLFYLVAASPPPRQSPRPPFLYQSPTLLWFLMRRPRGHSHLPEIKKVGIDLERCIV